MLGIASSGINWEIYIRYAGADGMLLHTYGKSTIGKLKSSLLCLSDTHCQFLGVGQCMMQSLKISNGWSESVYRRGTGNTMVKRKSTKRQTTIYKTYT